MAINTINKVIGMGLLTGALLLSGCGGGEDRQAKYLSKAQEYYDADNFDKAKIELKNVLQINPKNADAHYLMGEIYEKDKNFQGAFQQFSQAAETDKTHVKSLNKLAFYYLMSKDYENGTEKANAVLAIDANNADAMGNLAAIYASQEKKDEAIAMAQKALAAEPGHVQASSVLTAMYAQDNPELALSTITEAIAKQSKNESLKLMKIQLLMSQNKHDDVVAQYQELISEYPDNLLYRVQLVNFYLRDGQEEEQKKINYDKAEKILRDTVAEKPEEDEPKLWLVQHLFLNRTEEAARLQLEEFVKDFPENYTFRNQLAQLFVNKKELDKAKALYQQVVDNNPEGVSVLEARNKLASLAMMENDIPKAKSLLDEIFAIEPENADALISRAKLKLFDKDINGAIPDLRVVLKNDPESVEALTLLAGAHMQNNAPDLALDSYQRLLAVQPKNMTALLGTAQILLAKKQLKDALSMLEAAKEINPAHPEVVAMLTDLYSREQRWDDALSTAAKLTEKEETMAMGYYLQGRAYLRKKELKPGVEALEKSLELEPTGIESLSALVSGYIAMEQMDKALSYVKAHIAKYPDQLHAQELLGNLHATNGDLESALTLFKNIIEKNPARMQSYQSLSRIMATQGKLDELETLYLNGLQKSPDNSSLQMMLAELYQARGKFEQAVNTYEAVLKANPDALVVKNNLASLLMDHFYTPANVSRVTELAADLGATEVPAFLDTAGWVQYQLGNYPQAVALLTAALDKGGKGGIYHYHLGMAYFKSDIKAQAKEQLELALADENDKFPGREEAETTLKAL